MVGEEFKTWSADSINEENLVKFGLYISTLDYLEKGPPCFIELPDSGIEENR